MHEPEIAGGKNEMEWMRKAMHDLCQPLTALECCLFLGTLSRDGAQAPTPEDLLGTIRGALEQCERVTGQLRVIQKHMRD